MNGIDVTNLKEAKAIIRNLLSDKARLLKTIKDNTLTIDAVIAELQHLSEEVPYVASRLRAITVALKQKDVVIAQ